MSEFEREQRLMNIRTLEDSMKIDEDLLDLTLEVGGLSKANALNEAKIAALSGLASSLFKAVNELRAAASLPPLAPEYEGTSTS